MWFAGNRMQYLAPYCCYPWAVFNRKSLFSERGQRAPVTLDEYVTLAKQTSVIVALPALVAFLLLQRHFIAALTLGSGKG